MYLVNSCGLYSVKRKFFNITDIFLYLFTNHFQVYSAIAVCSIAFPPFLPPGGTNSFQILHSRLVGSRWGAKEGGGWCPLNSLYCTSKKKNNKFFFMQYYSWLEAKGNNKICGCKKNEQVELYLQNKDTFS
jgi:hypothetical protein